MSWFGVAFDALPDPLTIATLDTAQSTDGAHGRIKVRRAWISHDLGWLRGPKTAKNDPVPLPDMACLGVIEATVERGGKTTTPAVALTAGQAAQVFGGQIGADRQAGMAALRSMASPGTGNHPRC